MNILVFGATGETGQSVITQALEQGHHVTAFVRDPARLHISHPLLRHWVGDVMDASAVDAVMFGHDAVICVLGTLPDRKADKNRQQRYVPVCSVGTRHIIDAMRNHSIHRIVVESAVSVGQSRQTGRFWSGDLTYRLLKSIMDDKKVQEALLQDSDVDWTIVRPVKLNNGPLSDHIQSGEHLSWSLFSIISRADVAAFMLKALADDSTIHQKLTIRR